MAVTRLSVPPSEFWRMEPDHFWWLVETLSPPPKQGLSKAEREHAEWQASAK
jgi:hypothetical protein